MEMFPNEVFRHALSKQMIKHVRLPTKKDLGTKVTKVNDALASRHSDGPPTDHRMTVTRWLQELVATVPRLTPLPVMHPQPPLAMGTPAVCMGSHPESYRRNVTF